MSYCIISILIPEILYLIIFTIIIVFDIVFHICKNHNICFQKPIHWKNIFTSINYSPKSFLKNNTFIFSQFPLWKIGRLKSIDLSVQMSTRIKMFQPLLFSFKSVTNLTIYSVKVCYLPIEKLFSK